MMIKLIIRNGFDITKEAEWMLDCEYQEWKIVVYIMTSCNASFFLLLQIML